ncbi:thiol reductase thioredoxin [Niabella ginsenosidivorans]|uniref:Thiol reductase thioredoxin n=1 Tax=Niabella ginsenosidivorans TaxID=1176587 RepID=A0A1A9I9K4_9BACT|nr:thioredoxin family protein [Niabella ginsenosidivorans]ANH83392.1 thiol reductase thioredoxin [Niabella ginsenosidivorans]
MKQLLLISALMTLSLTNYAQDYETMVDEHNGKTHKMLTGHITDNLLKTDTAFDWFAGAQRIYEPKKEVVKTLSGKKDKVSYTVFMGTWCPDSQFVIPRFFKILDAAGIDDSKVSMTAVDRSKIDKNKEAERLKITNVPTIIVYNNDTELGRVVEYGTTGRFDEELAAIVKKAK